MWMGGCATEGSGAHPQQRARCSCPPTRGAATKAVTTYINDVTRGALHSAHANTQCGWGAVPRKGAGHTLNSAHAAHARQPAARPQKQLPLTSMMSHVGRCTQHMQIRNVDGGLCHGRERGTPSTARTLLMPANPRRGHK